MENLQVHYEEQVDHIHLPDSKVDAGLSCLPIEYILEWNHLVSYEIYNQQSKGKEKDKKENMDL